MFSSGQRPIRLFCRKRLCSSPAPALRSKFSPSPHPFPDFADKQQKKSRKPWKVLEL
jgi:hypothetical protein